MIRVAFVESFAKQYLSMQDAMRRNKKLVSTFKLVVVGVIFVVVLGSYARHVTLASTKGYFLREHMQEYDSLVFDRSIVKLEILQLERTALDEVRAKAGDRYSRHDRIINVATYDPDAEHIVD